MRLHGLGWRSVFHNELLAVGVAPDDLGTMLRQRLLWSQVSLQVMLKENPLIQRGLTVAQRLLYFSTMWGYLNGFAAIAYLAVPVVYLCIGILPVNTTALDFFLRFLPFMVANQILFAVAGRGWSTWRGQRFSFALFPVWITGLVTAIASVVFDRKLYLVVAPKARETGVAQWRLVWVQVTAALVLGAAAIVGIVRLAVGVAEPGATAIGLVLVAFDVMVLSVFVPAVLYMGRVAEEEPQ